MVSFRLWVAAAVSLAVFLLAAPAAEAGRAAKTPEEIAIACAQDIDGIGADAIAAVDAEFERFEDALAALPIDGPVGPAFKLAAASSARVDKLIDSYSRKAIKLSAKCTSKLNRLGADEDTLDIVENARADVVGTLQGGLRAGVQTSIAEDLQAFID